MSHMNTDRIQLDHTASLRLYTDKIVRRERPPLAPPSLVQSDAIIMHAPAQADAGAESVDAGLPALFEQYDLGDLCSDVCKVLLVEGVKDLAYVKLTELDDLSIPHGEA